MTRGKWVAYMLVCVVLGLLLGLVLVNGIPKPVFTLPTLVPTLSLPTPQPAALAVAPSPSPSIDTPVPRKAPSPTPTLDPTATFTPSPTSNPTATPTPTLTPTPLSLGAPALISVTATFTDTTVVPTSVPAVEVPDGAINIVVLGSDQRPDWKDWHTDAVHIISIQPAAPAVTVLSIPRDLYVYIPDFWMSRVNFADMYGEIYGYEGGGPALVQQTLLYNLGIPVDHYVRTDFDGFIGIVDALGGLDIPVHCRLEDHWPYPDENGEYPIKLLEPGVHHMDGETALWYARSRQTSSVFARERRQQQVLQAIWRKARSLDILPRLPELWGQLRGMVVTDLELADVLALAEVAFRIEGQNVRFRNIGYKQVIPWTTPKGGAVFLPDWEKIEPVVSEALGPVPEGRLWRTLQTLEIWNGTGNADWDQLAADRLINEGFVAVIGQPDRRDYAHTQLIDFTSTAKGSSIPYLQKMFDLADEDVISAPDPNMQAHYRLIIGADYQTCPSP